MNHMELQYFKTDKNGTKYFYDWMCPRCAGAGFADKWINTGRVCFACGGSGKRSVAKIVKEYTPAYWAQLEAKRQAKAAKEEEARKQYEEEHADEIAAKRAAEDQRIFEFRCSENGCGKDGIGFVLTGNTFPVKDQIKKAGGRWIYGCWVCPIEIKGNGITAKRIDISSHISTGMQTWKDDGFDFYEEIRG